MGRRVRARDKVRAVWVAAAVPGDLVAALSAGGQVPFAAAYALANAFRNEALAGEF